MSTDALIIGSAKMFNPEASFWSRKPFRMAVKMVLIEFAERSGIQIILK
jgi:hypothetical protein